jgi:hypothetical protein
MVLSSVLGDAPSKVRGLDKFEPTKFPTTCKIFLETKKGAEAPLVVAQPTLASTGPIDALTRR